MSCVCLTAGVAAGSETFCFLFFFFSRLRGSNKKGFEMAGRALFCLSFWDKMSVLTLLLVLC